MDNSIKAVRRAGIVLGVGLGGFVDGIVLHQILQWHHMLSSAGYPPETVGNIQLNVLADGLFHALTWVAVAIGLAMLWRATNELRHRLSGKLLLGALVFGWGLFNLVEGTLNHLILGIHHVREGPDQMLYDLAFLAFALLLLAAGWAVVQAGKRDSTSLPA
jgi:uncharacterized membrane protein